MKTKRKQSSVDVSLKIRYILGTKNRRRGKKKDVLCSEIERIVNKNNAKIMKSRS
jgi:hypothetical protein